MKIVGNGEEEKSEEEESRMQRNAEEYARREV
jgi:hypothetical protein